MCLPSLGAFSLLGVSIHSLLLNLVSSLVRGKAVRRPPWNAIGLEWLLPLRHLRPRNFEEKSKPTRDQTAPDWLTAAALPLVIHSGAFRATEFSSLTGPPGPPLEAMTPHPRQPRSLSAFDQNAGPTERPTGVRSTAAHSNHSLTRFIFFCAPRALFFFRLLSPA